MMGENGMSEERESQRQWLIKLLEARMEGKNGQYRRKEPVPMPERKSYRGSNVKIEPFSLKTESLLDAQLFERIRENGVKHSNAEEMHGFSELTDEGKKDWKAFADEAMKPVTERKRDLEPVGIIASENGGTVRKIPEVKLQTIAIPQIKIEQRGAFVPETKYQLSVEARVVVSEQIPELLAVPQKLPETVTKELKDTTEKLKKAATETLICPKISEMALTEPETLRKSKSVVLPEPVPAEMIQTAVAQLVQNKASFDHMEVTVPKEKKIGLEKEMFSVPEAVISPVMAEISEMTVGTGISGAMDVAVVEVKPQIRNLVEELEISGPEEEKKALEALTQNICQMAVCMPDFSEVWATLK